MHNTKSSGFERIITDVVIRMGYCKDFEEITKAICLPGDERLDSEASQDKLGFDKIYLQAKGWDKYQTVSAKEGRDFSGALSGNLAEKDIFITTLNFLKKL